MLTVKRSHLLKNVLIMKPNSTAFNTLPTKDRNSKGIEAVLLEYDISGNKPKPLWLFLVNPESLRFSKQAEYTEIKPLGSAVSHQQYVASGGFSLSISDMKLWTWCYGRSLRPLLEGVQKLLEADIRNNKYTPPVLKFQMGAREFGPCVLTSVNWDETAWLGGEPAAVTMGLEFREVPRVISRGQVEEKKEKAVEAAKETREKQGKPRLPLTDRQRADASAAAKKYLEDNIKVWSDGVQAMLRQKKYKLATDANTGAVKLSTGPIPVGTVLIWDGSKKKAGQGVTTIPVLKNAKIPEL